MIKAVYWVPHTHWDREWYRSFQSFRARLVDTIDQVLDMIADDPEFKFLLDGQTIVIEDYLEIRPQREDELNQAIRAGRLAIGPWYVQPDSLLPHGEAHIRNLLMGRHTAARHGPVSQVAYTPDSFGHPAQFPQLFAGFGFKAFIYWRGNGNEIDQLPSDYQWLSPDGTGIPASLLFKGYFNGAMLPAHTEKAIEVLKICHYEVAEKSQQDAVIIMNGIDHAPPRRDSMAMAHGLAESIDAEVKIELLDAYADQLKGDLPPYQGELVGGRLANLLPGVWSARMNLKLANRRCERALLNMAEPLAVLAMLYGLPDERASLRAAWRALLKNQAHDSIGGCSIDAVHQQMLPRYTAALSLAVETSKRIMERLAGQLPERQTPFDEPFEVAIFNPAPHTQSGVARLALDATPALASAEAGVIFHPLLAANNPERGFTVDGIPVRIVPANADGRFFFDDQQQALDLEIPIDAIPAMAYKRITLTPAPAVTDKLDQGTCIGNDALGLELEEGGTVCLTQGNQRWPGLFGVEDRPDKGDSYDADLLADDGRAQLLKVKHCRKVHPNGTEVLEVERLYRLPRELDDARNQRGHEETAVRLYTDFIFYPGSSQLLTRVRLKNTAKDHRLRLLFPTGAAVKTFTSATTLDVCQRKPGKADDRDWVHPAQSTFIHQGWNSVNDLTVLSPGLPEAEVLADGTLAITLVRSVGWLSRHDMSSRPGPAGPVIPAEQAQCIETIGAEITLFAGQNPVKAQRLEQGLHAVIAGPDPLLAPDTPCVELDSSKLVLSSIKPAEEGQGVIIRLLNPTNQTEGGRLLAALALVACDELSTDEQRIMASNAIQNGQQVDVELGPHQIKTFRLQLANSKH